MHDDSFQFSTDAELTARINQAMDNWDSTPTRQERERITAEYVSKQRAWERKLAATPPAQRTGMAAEGADEAEAEVALAKRGLIRSEAARLHLRRLNSEAERILKHAEERLQARSSPLMSSDEIDALRGDEAERAEAELRAWIAAHPPPTVADDEMAIDGLIDDTRADD